MTVDRATSQLLATVRVTGDELLDQVNAWNGPAMEEVLDEGPRGPWRFSLGAGTGPREAAPRSNDLVSRLVCND